MINDTIRQHKRRIEEKEVRIKLAAESEEKAMKLKKFTRDQPGWPPVEDTYPDLHEAISSSGICWSRNR